VHRQLTFIAITTALSLAASAQSPIVATVVAKAMALQPDTRHGGELYAKRCSRCHGPTGWGNGLEDIPSLAAQRELYLVTQLVEFATRERNGSTMHEAVGTKDVNNPQAIRDLATFLNGEPANPDPEHAEDPVCAAGKSLYQRNCAICHGAAAQGSSVDPVPALAGQHYDYTMIQIKSFTKGHRGQVQSPVIDFAAGLSDEEQKGIADYLSRIASTHR
jgi:cytochrome c553